ENNAKPAAFPDIRPLFGYIRAESGPLDTDALWTLKQALAPVRQLTQSILAENAGSRRYPTLSALAAFPLPDLTLAALGRCINDDGLLRDESSPELLLARAELRRLHQGCLRQVKDFSERYNIGHYLQDTYMTLASDRYVLPLKANFKGRLQGIVHDYSQTGETCYFEPMFLIGQNNRLQELKREEREEEHKVLVFLTQIVRNELTAIRAAWDLLVALDALRAKMLFGDACRGVSVTTGEGLILSLAQARHPLLALESKNRVQPVDLLLRQDDQALIISGGNAGGKTVCLKTLGLIAALTYAGVPAPAERGGTLPWWPDIQAFIGDEQSLDDHVSTFTAQIRHLNQAWPRTGRHSLVLLDEFGAGTDPAQGAALAQAVIDELLERGAYVVAATHFPALKIYALTRAHARAASVLFDPKTRRPLFHLAYDQVGASQALDVAREHGLPEAVLHRAERYLLLDGQDSGALLERLNALTIEREQEAARLREEQSRLRDKRARLQERFDQDQAKLEQDVRAFAHTIMREWQEGRLAHKQAMKNLTKVRKELTALHSAKVTETEPLAPYSLHAGQTVLYRPWNKQAVIREVDARQGRIKLDLNGVSLWADPAQIADSAAAADGKTGVPPSPVPGLARLEKLAGKNAENPLLRLDLRGKRADLAEEELTRFLDAALLAGRESAEIVHGRGTGALRKHVHAVLRTFPGIASYALASEDRGGDGMTIVTFR
ncbi:MAG: Smr/MutS family protein, partial [Deltaproteobacteria bacterium]|nr:Smr/MutS family protein [Deltaproteobacteria bacterium]